MIRMRGRKYKLGVRVHDPKRGFCPLFYVSALGISRERWRWIDDVNQSSAARTRHPRESTTPLRNEALLLFGVRNPEFLNSFLDSGILIGCMHTADVNGRRATQTIDIPAKFLLGHSPN
jgi:hypothetical protein